MKNLRTFCGLFVALLTTAIAANASEGKVTPKVCSGAISLSGGWSGEPTQHTDNTPTSLVGELKLRLQPVNLSGLRFDVDVFHPFFEDKFGFWVSNRSLTGTASIPVAKNTRAFVSYRRYYSGRTNDFMLAGVEVRW